jgi:hypothetical protein
MGFQFALSVYTELTIPDGNVLLLIIIHQNKNQTNEKFFKILLCMLDCNLCIHT